MAPEYPPKIFKTGSASLFIAGWPAALFVGLHGFAPAATLWNIAWYHRSGLNPRIKALVEGVSAAFE